MWKRSSTYAVCEYFGYDRGIEFPEQVKEQRIYEVATNFKSRGDLQYIVIPEGYNKINKSAFVHQSKLERISLPKTLRSIESQAFFKCSQLSSIILPAGLESCSSWAFGNCYALQAVYVFSDKCKYFDNPFANCRCRIYSAEPITYFTKKFRYSILSGEELEKIYNTDQEEILKLIYDSPEENK